jgi:hypothetical protein
MKKTLLILGGVGLMCVLLVARLLYKQKNGMNEERVWFVKAVRYEFSGRVDSIRMLNENTGRLWCRVTSGNPHMHREDSLKRFFRKHDMLYLIFRQSGDSIVFLVPNGKHVLKGDSVRVSSKDNSIRFFRAGKEVATDQLTSTLTGFGRPFFLKRK